MRRSSTRPSDRSLQPPIFLRGSYRFTAGIDGTPALLDGDDHERGVNLNAGATRRFGDYEGSLSLRAGKVEYQNPTCAFSIRIATSPVFPSRA